MNESTPGPEQDQAEPQELWPEFTDANILGGGHLVYVCHHGERFYCDDPKAGTWNDGELESLRADPAAHPLDYYAPSVEMLGHEWCTECPKCVAEAIRYQSFIWRNRRTISRFLNARLRTAAEDAAADLAENQVQEPQPKNL